MIVCIYGKGSHAFVEPTLRDLAAAAEARRARLVGATIERLAGPPAAVLPEATFAYLLPFEAPAAEADAPATIDALIASLLPNAAVANSIAAHDLCTDRVLLSERLLERGIPVPETLLTNSPEEARDFIRSHEHVISRDVRMLGRGGGFVVFSDGSGTVIGEARGRRYVIEFEESGLGCRLRHGVLSHPPPFFLQRLITRVGRAGVLLPAQVLRAYVVDEEIPFWTETYRDRVRRPSDFLLSAEAGAPLRFVQVVSDEAKKLARRVAKVVGARIAAVDIIRSDSGYVVLDVVTDGQHLMIDRSFKSLPEYRGAFDLDRHIVNALIDAAG